MKRPRFTAGGGTDIDDEDVGGAGDVAIGSGGFCDGRTKGSRDRGDGTSYCDTFVPLEDVEADRLFTLMYG